MTATVENLEIKRLTKENRELKKYFESIAVVVAQSIAALDAEMKLPPSNERGKRIAAVCNQLEHVNDSLMHFGLKFEFKKINKIKKRWDIFKAARASEAAIPCAHCGNPSKNGMCSPCFFAGHRGTVCDKYCRTAQVENLQRHD